MRPCWIPPQFRNDVTLNILVLMHFEVSQVEARPALAEDSYRNITQLESCSCPAYVYSFDVIIRQLDQTLHITVGGEAK